MRLDGGSEAEARERTVGHILNIQVIFAIITVILFMIVINLRVMIITFLNSFECQCIFCSIGIFGTRKVRNSTLPCIHTMQEETELVSSTPSRSLSKEINQLNHQKKYAFVHNFPQKPKEQNYITNIVRMASTTAFMGNGYEY